jgi:putative alpha-1,2-mannosidase
MADYCFPTALNKTSEYTSFVKRGSNWKTLWNPKVEDSGHKGFIQPKYPNGTWNYYPPQFCGPTMNHTSCFLNDLGGEFYEESPWAYSFFVPQDQQGLINTVGGSKEFVSRLDTYFEKGYHDMGDEPAFLVPFQYIFAGRPDKATTRVHDLLTTQYNTTIEGLPGNDDSGAMGSFVNWVMMGLYPVAGTDLWLLTTPFFDSYTIDLVAINSNFTVKCNNLSDSNKYINSATLNGKPLNRAWLRHAEFAISNQPAVLELTMGSKWNGWGSTELPPSMTQAKGTAQW